MAAASSTTWISSNDSINNHRGPQEDTDEDLMPINPVLIDETLAHMLRTYERCKLVLMGMVLMRTWIGRRDRPSDAVGERTEQLLDNLLARIARQRQTLDRQKVLVTTYSRMLLRLSLAQNNLLERYLARDLPMYHQLLRVLQPAAVVRARHLFLPNPQQNHPLRANRLPRQRKKLLQWDAHSARH
jgi:hypothetical protein